MQRHMKSKRVRLFHDVSMSQYLSPTTTRVVIPKIKSAGRLHFIVDLPSVRINVCCIANEFAEELTDRGEGRLVLDAVCRAEIV
jgi:hypothetical protein